MPSRAEPALLAIFGLGLLLILQPWIEGLYRAGLVAVIGASLLNIAVGNVPQALPPGRAALRLLLLLGILAAVFGAGYKLVPVLAGLGR